MLARAEFDDNIRVGRRVRPKPEPASPSPRRDPVARSPSPRSSLVTLHSSLPCHAVALAKAGQRFSFSEFQL
jgi:hypothetical protein